MVGLYRIAITLALVVSGYAAAETSPIDAEFSSGAQRVALLELFTSEGCSSCPPADRWLSGLRTDPGLWKTFTPIAFHVDYWDYIGWKDRFARAAYSDRQRRHASEGNARFVYTPGFFSNGREWRGWRSGRTGEPDSAAPGDLTLTVNRSGISVRFDAADNPLQPLIAHVALLGMDLETPVGAGENEGKMLRHDFVALQLLSTPFDNKGDQLTARLNLPQIAFEPGKQALVAWVAAVGSQRPLQSVGGFLPAN